jgi:predicted metal-dependent hydrolase
METKISKLRAAAASCDWTLALRIAARFPDLGEHAATIVRAHEAGHNPRFYRSLGKDPDALIAAGIDALKARYKIA